MLLSTDKDKLERESFRHDAIEQDELIRAAIGDVFHAMTVPRHIDEWGGGPARIQPRLNGRYSLWDGEMQGTIKEFEFPCRLVYTLREWSWEESWLDSLVVWQLEEEGHGTRLHLYHTGLPSRRILETHREGWGEYFIGPLKAYLERR